ncbi:MAG: aminoacyltransferase [Bifidobacteriaceae bacterium]|jgi:lipid II:glycine glycyltransferase (peptidoglycan interpeptide bridge formation enzyme)|nr:aminoacyltransferase [Bifidobacteriaceae bacterium]
MPFEVRPIDAARHLAWIARRPSVSFLQTPAWAGVKASWCGQSVGWFDGAEMIGAALVLLRPAPLVHRQLAYVPEGPDLPWDRSTDPARDFLAPLIAYAKSRKAFALTVGPTVWWKRWETPTVKAGLSAARKAADAAPNLSDEARRLRAAVGTGEAADAEGPAADGGAACSVPEKLDDLAPDQVNPVAEALIESMSRAGWRAPEHQAGFAAGQPQYVFQLPLAGRTEEDLLKGFNQLWRRNIKRAEKNGVEVTVGTRADLEGFHRIYAETAGRDGFRPRPLSYFEGMWDQMAAEDPGRLTLYLATVDGELIAATTMVRVGDHAWYSYGASTTAHRDVRGSNAIQWRMIRDALAAGCSVYDLRGITDTLDPGDSHAGLIGFKVGTGGRAQSYPGEWTYAINRPLFAAYQFALSRR